MPDALLGREAEAAVWRDVAADLEHDLVAVAQAQPARVEAAATVHPDRDRPAEGDEPSRAERPTPDREQARERSRPVEVDDAAGVERPDSRAAAGGEHAPVAQPGCGDPDSGRDDHDAPVREQLEVDAAARAKRRRAAGEARVPCRRTVGGPLADGGRDEPADGERERRRCEAGDRHRGHGTCFRRPLTLLAVLAVAAAAAVPAARADGDPASDYLIGQKIFLPYDAKVPARQAKQLSAAVRSANAQGFAVRVALIWSDYDLGSVTQLWKKPRTYARFLGIELSYYFKGHLLVVMPNGLGLYWHGHSAAPGYTAIAAVTVQPKPAGLAVAATDAVRRLAAASGVTVSTSASGTTTPETAPAGNSYTHDRIVIAAAVLVALALGALFRLLIRRRAAADPPR